MPNWTSHVWPPFALKSLSFQNPFEAFPLDHLLLSKVLLSSADVQHLEEMSDGTVPGCRPLNERTISASCTQLQKCCSLLQLVYTIWPVWEIQRFHGRLEKSSKLSQSGKLILASGSSECPFPSPLTLFTSPASDLRGSSVTDVQKRWTNLTLIYSRSLLWSGCKAALSDSENKTTGINKKYSVSCKSIQSLTVWIASLVFAQWLICYEYTTKTYL